MKVFNKWALLTVVMIIVLLTVTGCGNSGNGDDPGDHQYDEDIITIECPEAGQLEISVEELMNLESITEEIVRHDDNGNIEDQYPIKGVLLENVLAHLNISSDGLETIRMTAGDGYSVEVPNHILNSREIILAYGINDEPLHDDTRPIRIFIPDEESMYWVRNTVTISLSRTQNGGTQSPGEQTSSLDKIFFFETMETVLNIEDYTAEADAKAVTVAEMFENVQAGNLVHMLASDGFEKNEEYSTVVAAYIVVQGENTPAFRGPDLPRGMHVRDLVLMTSGDTGFAFVEKGLEYFEITEADGNKGISLKDLADKIGLAVADNYVLESVDGYAVEISYEDLEAGIVYFRESGELSSAFDGLPRNTAVKDLLSIRAAD